MRFQSASLTDVGLKRKVNEDSFLERPERALWVVCDGMGGHEAGDVASAMVIEMLDAAIGQSAVGPALDEAEAALERANATLIERMHGDLRRKTGTTVVGLIIGQDGRYGCFWAGDSRAYLVRDGQIAQITRDHSLVQQLVDSKLLSPDEAESHPDANVITRAIGGDISLEVDRVCDTAKPNDIFILATDGLTRCVSNDEIRAAVTTANPHQACVALVEKVLARGAPDNVTLIVVRVA